MPKVYVVNRGGHDFSLAEEYGELVYITSGKLNRFALNHMYRVLSETLNESSREDFIIITGLTTLIAIACSIFAYKHSRLNLLVFKDGRYVERHLLIGELVRKEEDNEKRTKVSPS